MLRKSKIFYSRYAIVLAAQHWNAWHTEKLVRSNVIEGLRMHTNFSNLVKVLKLYLKILLSETRSQLL
jgi:hypothetical protein